MQKRLQFFRQFFRHSLRLFVNARAGVKGLGFEDELAVLIGDAVAEVQPHSLEKRRPDFNRQQIVVACGRFEAQPRLDDRENHVLFLPVQDGRAERADEFAPRRLEQIEVARVINMVADGAFGVGDAVRVAERSNGHGARLSRRTRSSRPKPESVVQDISWQ